jgi:hypothetical protein
MSFTEVLQELSALTPEQRQLVIHRALEIDDASLSSQDEALIDSRVAAHRADPSTSRPADEMMSRLEKRFGK